MGDLATFIQVKFLKIAVQRLVASGKDTLNVRGGENPRGIHFYCLIPMADERPVFGSREPSAQLLYRPAGGPHAFPCIGPCVYGAEFDVPRRQVVQIIPVLDPLVRKSRLPRSTAVFVLDTIDVHSPASPWTIRFIIPTI